MSECHCPAVTQIRLGGFLTYESHQVINHVVIARRTAFGTRVLGQVAMRSM